MRLLVLLVVTELCKYACSHSTESFKASCTDIKKINMLQYSGLELRNLIQAAKAK